MSKELNGTIRSQRGTAANRILRGEGSVPGVVYGQQDPVAVTINHKELRKLIEAYGTNTLMTLSVEGDSVPKRTVIIKDHQTHPIKEGWVHVDFYEVDMTEEIKTVVPILLEGKSPAEKLGGIVQQSLDELHIRCLPGNIPHDIKVDMTKVEMDQVVHVSDLTLPADIEVIDDPEEAVVSIHEVKEEVEKTEEEEAAEAGEAEEGEKAAAPAEGKSES
ncbi:50S ribosomal protein L25 [Nitrospina watsonii]|uniref:Large ribosomal subunit protein bL25 n=1 Tax=Nitrospina watsonii TaxID=1323948 RepID=A0ABM9HHR9_9BACT|nr:50S ribosomal protein L25 [Nitrospina watsonii]CAI2719601.1 50S ribosomal protein L25 [Nitrospina watsonii]